jgi:glutamate formiminotransferase
MNEPVVACVPNFSEGREPAIIHGLVAAMHLPGVHLLDCTSNREANRSVVTIAGEPAAVFEAVVRAAGVAVERIDLTAHRGNYPRMGAIDVLPFVPVSRIHIAECAVLAREAAVALWDRFQLPCYLYEAAAMRPDRIALDEVRQGQFEGLREVVLRDANRRPDIGGPGLHPTAGAAAVGARQPLIECRLTLATEKLSSARATARALRDGFAGVHATGFVSPEGAQVLLKIDDYRETGIAEMHACACDAAKKAGTRIAAGEIVGLIPEGAYQPGSAWAANDWAMNDGPDAWDNSSSQAPEDERETGASAYTWEIEQRILERRLLAPLAWPESA